MSISPALTTLKSYLLVNISNSLVEIVANDPRLVPAEDIDKNLWADETSRSVLMFPTSGDAKSETGGRFRRVLELDLFCLIREDTMITRGLALMNFIDEVEQVIKTAPGITAFGPYKATVETIAPYAAATITVDMNYCGGT